MGDLHHYLKMSKEDRKVTETTAAETALTGAKYNYGGTAEFVDHNTNHIDRKMVKPAASTKKKAYVTTLIEEPIIYSRGGIPIDALSNIDENVYDKTYNDTPHIYEMDDAKRGYNKGTRLVAVAREVDVIGELNMNLVDIKDQGENVEISTKTYRVDNRIDQFNGEALASEEIPALETSPNIRQYINRNGEIELVETTEIVSIISRLTGGRQNVQRLKNQPRALLEIAVNNKQGLNPDGEERYTQGAVDIGYLIQDIGLKRVSRSCVKEILPDVVNWNPTSRTSSEEGSIDQNKVQPGFFQRLFGI